MAAPLKLLGLICFVLKFSFIAPATVEVPKLVVKPYISYLENRTYDTPIHTGGRDHECFRRCEHNAPKTCVYNITVNVDFPMFKCGNCPFVKEDCEMRYCITAGGYRYHTVSVANSMLPGPGVLVCENDTIVFNVENGFDSDSTSIHFHGAHQRATPWMDGTPFVTQCPIMPETNFQYKFMASPAGTHMWHGHTGVHEADGLFGLYIVRKPEDFENTLYDFDEHEMILWLWPNITATTYVSATNPWEQTYTVLVNGKAAAWDYEKDGKIYRTPRQVYTVEKGKRYRFRTIYNSIFTCPMQVSFDNHKMLMFASESGEFTPVEVDSLHIHAGERYDYVIHANAEVGTYWIRLRSITCDGDIVNAEAILRYVDSPDEEPKSEPDLEHRLGRIFNPIEAVTRNNTKREDMVELTDVDSTLPTRDMSGSPDIIMYMELRFGGDTIYPKINGITFQAPNSPLYTQFNYSEKNCMGKAPEKFCMSGVCRCTQMQKIPLNSLVEIVMVDTTPENTQEHPMHMHGYHFQTVAMGVIGNRITVDQVRMMNHVGEIKKKFKNVFYKDTVNVPNFGYTVIRMYADNPGFWFFHCHFTDHTHIGMSMVLQVGDPEKDMPKAPEDLPHCEDFPSKHPKQKTGKSASFVSSLMLVVGTLCSVLVLNW